MGGFFFAACLFPLSPPSARAFVHFVLCVVRVRLAVGASFPFRALPFLGEISRHRSVTLIRLSIPSVAALLSVVIVHDDVRAIS